jgi:hypothetical protein
MQAWEARLSGTARSLEAPALRFTDPDGSTGTLRLRVRGDAVIATLQTSDAAMAGRLERELPGLQQSLRDRGIENARVHLAVAAGTTTDSSNDSREDGPSDPSRQSPERPPKRDAETRQSPRQRSPWR